MNTSGDFQNLLIEQDGAVLWLTLNRPDKLNAFTADMHAELKEVLFRVQTSEDIRALVITGAGRGFCAGQDLGDLDMDALGDVVEQHFNPLIRTLTTLNIPVIAAINGVAAGAGANMALCCDIVIAARSARFIQSFSHIGLVPDAGGTWTLPRLIGLPRAMALVMTGEAVGAEKAADWGMIWKAVDDDTLKEEVNTLAQKLASQATVGLGFTRQLLRQGMNRTLDEQLDMERDFQQAASNTADFQEGVDAFLNKRPARFEGR